jgi:hypothetical protein
MPLPSEFFERARPHPVGKRRARAKHVVAVLVEHVHALENT